ncbi:hypothetical protein RKE29_06010 [Streptomyces sp. B1866]|uniref:hypothetical protein n=1 Tax=Streptomyces sp. B1866 TaxID=3075431 RepID=UPI0028922CE8|nr:hypothetical protein [Streptomyces sp. B1866]MDT3396194.1 hypothetical protein [Streptomyces sp. B1866]
MSVDQSDPEMFDSPESEEFAESGDHGEFGAETPEADAAEQRHDLRPYRDEPLTSDKAEAVNEADRAEQARVVELDEDDYR